MLSELIRDISKRIYSLFVVNTYAAGIQQKDGRYITKYIPVSAELIERMISSNGSMGCYQQGYKTGYIKWICLDFDCKDKNNPDLIKLYEEIICPVKKTLDQIGLRYLTEFSGRRGIHIWIVFNKIIKKEIGFAVLEEILKRSGMAVFESEKWGLDLFPATDSSRGNKVGKQVKFPLSCHQSGAMSFLFEGAFHFYENCGSEEFFTEQLDILNRYTPNEWESVIERLGIDAEFKQAYSFKFRQYKIFGCVKTTTDEVIEILSQINVFDSIFKRMKSGRALSKDWTVLLGTLAHCDEDGSILKALLEEFPNYDEKLTLSNIVKLRDSYYPATFGYLYQLYGMEKEEWLLPDETGLSYLLQKKGIDHSVRMSGKDKTFSELQGLYDVENTIRKEQKYLLDNDEAPDVHIWNLLHMYNNYDRMKLKNEIEQIESSGHYYCNDVSFRVFERIESEKKTRKMVSLSAHDRILTTHLALLFYRSFKMKHQIWSSSFSYIPALTSKNDIFFAWYSSWSFFIHQLKAVLEVPFFDEFSIFYIDLKGFYDHVDFVVISDYISKSIEETPRNILNGLIEINDSIMTKMNSGLRKGVPQGPAYARIIAEVFLGIVLDDIIQQYSNFVTIYRYVDDIVVLCKPGFDHKKLFSYTVKNLVSKGLPVNMDKSCCFGLIKNLSEKERRLILHSENFIYDLRNARDGHILLTYEKKDNLLKYVQSIESFDINLVGLFFGSETSDVAKRWCFTEHGSEIIKEKYGRGSNYKRFYQYLFSDNDLIREVIEKNWLEEMPLDSINFSNYISVLYISLQTNKIDMIGFGLLRDNHLVKIKNSEGISLEDKTVLDSLLRIELVPNK